METSAERFADGKDTVVHTALRPFVTTGIAIVGASVIAVAPVTLPPPQSPSVEVVAADVVRSVSADVELTALADVLAAFPQAAAVAVQLVLQAVPLPAEFESLVAALANAGVPAVTETVKLFTETIPTTAQNMIATGKFAHLPVLAIQAVILGVVTPPAQYLSALVQELPLPFGTPDGLIDESFKLLFQTPTLAGLTILNLLADVFDSGLSPVAALSGMIDAISTAVTSAAESIGKIVAASSGALPFAALQQPEAPDNARTMALAADVPAADDTSFVAPSVNSSPPDDSVGTVAVESSALSSVEEASEDEPERDDVTTNGATDLTDGNKAEPGDTVDESAEAAAEAGDASTTATVEDTTTAEDASADHAATNTGSNEGSGADGEASETDG